MPRYFHLINNSTDTLVAEESQWRPLLLSASIGQTNEKVVRRESTCACRLAFLLCARLLISLLTAFAGVTQRPFSHTPARADAFGGISSVKSGARLEGAKIHHYGAGASATLDAEQLAEVMTALGAGGLPAPLVRQGWW